MAGTNQAFGATNTRDDPAYWEAQLTHINPLLRAQAQTNLARIRQEQRQRQQDQQFQQGQQSRAADRAAGREQRGQEFQSRQRDAQLKQQQLEAYRQSQQANQQTEQRRQQGAGLLNVAQSPLLMQLYGKDAPGIQKNLLNMFMQQTAGGAGPTGGLPLAAQTVDPKAQRVAEFQKGQGAGVKAPQGAPQQQTQAAPQQVTMAPSSLAAEPTYPPGSYDTPSGIPHIGGSPAIPSNRLIQHGQIVGGPPGQDLNINTGEWVPSDLVGTINGKPSTQYLAEKALKSGVSPEDTRSRALYNQMKQGVEVPPALGDSQGSPSRDVMMLNQPKNIRAQGGPTELQGPPMETAASGAVVPEKIPTNPAGEPQWPSGAMSSGLHSGQFLADQLKQLPISFNPVGHPGENQMSPEQLAVIEEQRRKRSQPK